MSPDPGAVGKEGVGADFASASLVRSSPVGHCLALPEGSQSRAGSQRLTPA